MKLLPSRNDTPARIIVMGASAGGVDGYQAVLSQLPVTLDAAVFVVLHIPAHTPSVLAQVLQRNTPWPVSQAEDGERISAGRVYVARADHHLVIEPGKVRLTRGPKESRARPAIDALFRSAAVAYGPQVIGVVLSGMLDDGTAGLWAVKDRGGIALVQDPDTATYDGMPRSAAQHVDVDAIVPLDRLAAHIAACAAARPKAVEQQPSHTQRTEVLIAREGNGLKAGVMTLGKVSGYTCPECHGVLVQIEEGSIVRFRCHTGHAYSLQTLLAEVNESVETGLWDALRALEERILLLRQMGELAGRQGDKAAAERCKRQADEVDKRVESVRQLVLDPAIFDREAG